MKIVIVGGVAAGTKAAAKLKRENPDAKIILYTKSKHISYAGCGLPYYIGGSIESKEKLIVNTPEKFMALTRTTVHTECEVTAVDPSTKSITVNHHETVNYDKLVLAVGAEPIIPSTEGVTLPGIFTVRTPEDAIQARAYADTNNCKRAVVIGAGFIGLEVAENLSAKGISVTVIDMAQQILPHIFDPEMADYIRRQLQKKGIRILTGTTLKTFSGIDRLTSVQTDAGTFSADLAVLAIGIRPATDFLKNTELELEHGCIITDEHQQTNLPDIYAVGDCALVKNRITKKKQWSAMGLTANLTGRALALNISGTPFSYNGCLGTGIIKLADDLNAARTGLTELQAKEAGFDTISITCVTDDKAHYYPDSSTFITKLIADRTTHHLLGMQVIGAGAVDKMTDIAVVGISTNAKAEDFMTMDFAYAPPFSTAIHPFAAACNILVNKLTGRLVSFTPAEYAAGAAKDYTVIDTQPVATISGAEWIDLVSAEEMIQKFDKNEKLLLVCTRGKRAYLLQNRLRALGYENTRVLEGGVTFNVIQSHSDGQKLSADEIKRVKGLGCLQDKRFPDVFNVRVITRNGKISVDEHRAVAEAAELFGSGEVTMTSRLTLEIQGVRYTNIEPLIDFLHAYGLETGGTGSLVRPIVSCKGTTCQYGLIDTFGLSEKLHERFYKGYHSVTLPHKFKIAVGGCPNNCVKPNLNDLGIIGQRIPLFDYSKCRGCKKCLVETSCPIHVANVTDGKLSVDMEACNHCGRCKEKCPFGVTEEYTNGYKVFIGGRWGKKIANGRPLSKIFTSEEEVLDVVERAILFFRNEGITGERFADTVTRLGFDYVQDCLLYGEIKKDEILEKKVKGGAAC